MVDFERALQDPCMKHFGFVGHGVDGDSKNDSMEESDADAIFINADEVIYSSDMKRLLNGKKLEFVILHACFQGALHNRVRWRNALGVKDAQFHAWKGAARYFTTYWWEFFDFTIPQAR